MKLPFLEKAAKHFTKSASEQVKKEIRKTGIDLIPGLLTIGGMVVSMFVFYKSGTKDNGVTKDIPISRPYTSTTKITTNNYFLGEVSEEIIKKILEGSRYD